LRKNPWIGKCVAVGIILLFISIVAAPGITVSTPNERIKQSIVGFCGLNGYNTIALTVQQAVEVNVICETYQSQMEKVSSMEEAESILNRAFIELAHYGLLEGTNLQQTQGLLQDNRMIPRSLVHVRSFPGLFCNICCFLTATFPWGVEWDFGVMPSVWPIGLAFILLIPLLAITEDIPLLGDISLGLAMLCVLQPLKVMNFVIVFGDGVIHSVGLKGIVDTKDTLALLLGYTGLIIIQPKLDKVTLIGYALAIFGG
jgi:hypothetical protein